jgi:hypothetical protein
MISTDLKMMASTSSDWGTLSETKNSSSDSWLCSLIPDQQEPKKVFSLQDSTRRDFTQFLGKEKKEEWANQTLSTENDKSFVPSIIMTGIFKEGDEISALYDNPDIEDQDFLPPATILVLKKVLEDDLIVSDFEDSLDSYYSQTESGSSGDDYSFGVASDYSPCTIVDDELYEI